jgi:hypothetical protein
MEEKLCRILGVDAVKVNATKPRAVIVGEAPGIAHRDCPLFPYPEGSEGWRLWKYSELPLQDYFEIFQRINLVDSMPQGKWPSSKAEERAYQLIVSAAVLDWPIVMCGIRVARAFGVDMRDYFKPFVKDYAQHDAPEGAQAIMKIRIVKIPSASGRALKSNDMEQRYNLQMALAWAGGRLPQRIATSN